MIVPPRDLAIITGAAGGMGRACARLFGATHDLLLTDIAAPPLDRFAAELESEGFTVRGAHAGDLADPALLSTITGAAGARRLILLHTAGLSPSLAGWRAIMTINLVATVKLLDAIEPILTPGSVAVLIASMAGHMLPAIPEAKALMADPLAPHFLDAVGAMVAHADAAGTPGGSAGFSYGLSKQAVIALAERRAVQWGRRGARIVSISPGLILTPMGRKELAETAGAAQLNDSAPVGRSGTAMEIACAARFLASEEASFITGCDLRVDGGGVAATRMMSA